MNYIWCGMVLVSVFVSFLNGTADETITAALEGAEAAVSTLFSFAGIMCFWTGIMKIAEESGLCEKLGKMLGPLISFLFPNCGNDAKKYISMNMSANLLGMGNAATPMGIKAMTCLDGENKNPTHISKNMCMLVVLNTASLQIIPTTIIALRTAAGSQAPMSVIAPIWISSLTAATASITLTKLFFRERT